MLSRKEKSHGERKFIRLAKTSITSLQSTERWQGASLGRGALGGHHSPLTVTPQTETVLGISLPSQSNSELLLVLPLEE